MSTSPAEGEHAGSPGAQLRGLVSEASRLQLIMVGLGLIMIFAGAYLAISQLNSFRGLLSWGLWLLLPPLLSDLILMPLAALVGWATWRRAPVSARVPMLVAEFLTVVFLIIALPFLAGWGANADNPSLLDRNYVAGTAIYLTVIWASAAAWALVRSRSAKREAPASAT